MLFQLTIGQILKNYESKIDNYLYNKEGRQEILNKIKDEMKSANQKESIRRHPRKPVPRGSQCDQDTGPFTK